MPQPSLVGQLMRFYPRIFFACHLRHRRDPASGERLSAHQGSILDHLDREDGTPVGELASHMGVTPGTMSIHLDRLERKGFVTRSPDPHDGRRVQIRLTAAGVRVREANTVLDSELVGALLDEVALSDRQSAIDALKVLAEAADRLMASRAGGAWRKRSNAS